MPGYLLDDNHVQPYWRKESDVLRAKLARFTPPVMIRVCTITLGEIAFGHHTTVSTDQRIRDEFTAWLNSEILPHALAVSIHTRKYYAMILAEIWKRHPPKTRKVKTERHLVELGVDVNDVWAVAVAWEHGLTFCTTDRMERIRKATEGKVTFDCWL